ncbi:hypothetical protein [Brevundimonas sp.]|uniref:hypothetical protein n=1 Tax=Brevundimonas sp. TaxID=1871086 RepID=UPI00286CD8FB|nr:hypothetical protein [Brevundimonas sp.]
MKTSPKQPARRPILEWVVAGLGLLGVMAAFGLILTEALAGPAGPPELGLAAVETRSTGSGWVVEIEATNTGDRTAAGVQVEGRLGTETATAELDYVPAHGQSVASLGFDQDPRQGLQLIVLGWREP